MEPDTYTHATSQDLAYFIKGHVRTRLVLALPSVHDILADAVLEVAPHLKGRVVVVLDPTENIYRLGYGSFAAVERLRAAGVAMLRREGLRLGCVLMDDVALFLAPSAHLVESETTLGMSNQAPRINAAPIQPAQAEAYLRDIADHPDLTFALTGAEPEPNAPEKAVRFRTDEQKIVSVGLEEAPPANFPLARQVRVFQAHMQYVEIKLEGCELGRRTFSIPKSVLPMNVSKDLKEDLEAKVALVPASLEEKLAPISRRVEDLRTKVAKQLNAPYGTVLLKSSKENFEKEAEEIRADLVVVRTEILKELGTQLETRMKEIVDLCSDYALVNPPADLLRVEPRPTPENVRRFVEHLISRAFPRAEGMIKEMCLTVHYKDVTFETLNQQDFLTRLTKAYPHRDWEKAYQESMVVKGEEPKLAENLHL